MSFRAKLLLTLGGSYVVQLLFFHWLKLDYFSVLALSPPDSPTFRWWQILTFSLTGSPGHTIIYVADMWLIYFCAEPVVAVLGRFSFFVLFFGASLFSISTWWLFSSSFKFMHFPAFGFSASTFALLMVFCRTHGTATLQMPQTMWMPIVPTHLLYFFTFGAVTGFLAHENPAFGLEIGGLIFAVIYTTRGERLFLGTAHWFATAPWKMRLRWRRRRRGIRLIEPKSDSKSDSSN